MTPTTPPPDKPDDLLLEATRAIVERSNRGEITLGRAMVELRRLRLQAASQLPHHAEKGASHDV